MTPLAERIYRLCELLFSDIQQREAARQIGVAHPLLSRTLSGAREPSKTLVERLSKHPSVNERWLLHGIGEPLKAGSCSLSVLDRIPLSSDAPWSALEVPKTRLSISEARRSQTRYWFHVSSKTYKSWGSWSTRCRALPGDHLLIETGRSQMDAMFPFLGLVVACQPSELGGKPTWGLLGRAQSFSSFSSTVVTKRPAKRVNRSRLRRRLDLGDPEVISTNEGNFPHARTKSSAGIAPKIEKKHVLAMVIEMRCKSLFVQDKTPRAM